MWSNWQYNRQVGFTRTSFRQVKSYQCIMRVHLQWRVQWSAEATCERNKWIITPHEVLIRCITNVNIISCIYYPVGTSAHSHHRGQGQGVNLLGNISLTSRLTSTGSIEYWLASTRCTFNSTVIVRFMSGMCQHCRTCQLYMPFKSVINSFLTLSFNGFSITTGTHV